MTANERGWRIRAAMRERKLTCKAVAAVVPCSPSMVSKVIHGAAVSAPVRTALAEALEFDPWQRWPDGGDDTAAAG